MGNPYQPNVVASKHDYTSPALEVDTEAGPEKETELPQAKPQGQVAPEGTIKEILDWVDGKKDRAEAALEKEKSDSDPRDTLLNKLKKVIEG